MANKLKLHLSPVYSFLYRPENVLNTKFCVRFVWIHNGIYSGKEAILKKKNKSNWIRWQWKYTWRLLLLLEYTLKTIIYSTRNEARLFCVDYFNFDWGILLKFLVFLPLWIGIIISFIWNIFFCDFEIVVSSRLKEKRHATGRFKCMC